MMDGTFDDWVDNGCKLNKAELDSLLQTLAEMGPIEYDQARKSFAKEHNIQLKTLDREIEKLRRSFTKETEQCSGFEVIEPWDWPVDGSELLQLIDDTIKRFCIMPDHCSALMATWCVHAWCHDCFDISPVLALISPEKRCGKTTAMSVLGALLPKPMHSANMTGAVMFRIIEAYKPSLLIDEADTFLAGREEMRGMINAGHNRNCAYVWRSVGDDHEPRRFGVWAPKAIAMIGKLPDTIEDRALVVTLKRKETTEKVERFHFHQTSELLPIRRQLARWAKDNRCFLESHNPELPDELNDRAQDNARCLCAIATGAGGKWPDLIRSCLVELARLREDDVPASKGIMLLRDIAKILERWKGDRIKSSDLVAELVAIEDGPWVVWGGSEPISTRMLATLLKPYDVRPKRDSSSRFYSVSELRDCVSRYTS